MNTVRQQPKVSVGVLHSNSIEFVFNTDYRLNPDCKSDSQSKELGNRKDFFKGEQRVEFHKGKIMWDGKEYSELLFDPIYKKIGEQPSFWIRSEERRVGKECRS